MSRREDRFRELCAGRVLGTLSEDERWELDALLESAGPEMLRSYDELEVAALLLPVGVESVEPRPEIRVQMLEAVRSEARRSAGRTSRRRADPGRRRNASPAWRRAAVVGLVALSAVALGLSFYSASLTERLGAVEQRAQSLADDLQERERLLSVLQSKQFEVVVLEGIDTYAEAFGKLIWDRENGVAVLQVANLPRLADDQIYQLWVFASDRPPTSAGVFAVDDPERDTLFRFDRFTPVDRRSIRGFLVTREPDGGVAEPGDVRCLGGRIES